MKKTRLFALLCAFFLLAGCTTSTAPADTPSTPEPTSNTDPAPSGSKAATVPPETESPEPRPAARRVEHLDLEPLPAIAPEDRCQATALGRIAETESGYYFCFFDYLYYADKSDMSQWVLVCNKPDCAHGRNAEDVCNAVIFGAVWVKDGSIYTANPWHEAYNTPDFLLKSKGDGSSWEAVLSDPDCPFAEGGYTATWQFHNGVCASVSQMGTDGSYDNYLYVVDETGAHKLTYAEDLPDAAQGSNGTSSAQARGDVTMWLVTEFEEPAQLYRVSPDSLEKLVFPEGCSYNGAYLSRDTMIHYHPNDGYYKLDYSAGVEAKIDDAAYQDGFGYCLDGQFLVETTLDFESTAAESKLRYFDGETWTEVALPEDMAPQTNLRIVALTSDTLFLDDFRSGGALYMVKLGDNRLVKCMDYTRWG